MNSLRGEFSFTLNKKKYQACLSLNAMRIMCKAMGVKLNDMDQWLNDDPLTAIPAFAYYGVKNQAARKGKDSGLPDFEHFCAMALDDQDTINTMIEAVSVALGTGDDNSGN